MPLFGLVGMGRPAGAAFYKCACSQSLSVSSQISACHKIPDMMQFIILTPAHIFTLKKASASDRNVAKIANSQKLVSTQRTS